jgi:hypothetical protein
MNMTGMKWWHAFILEDLNLILANQSIWLPAKVGFTILAIAFGSVALIGIMISLHSHYK